MNPYYKENPMDPDTVDGIIQDYAVRAEEIYNNRTAGDFTWVGFLATFTRELQTHSHV